MLAKLSLRNAKRQAGDYLVYFVTIALAAALIYAFNELAAGPEMQLLAGGVAAMPIVITLITLMVVGILGWLVYYTQKFILQKRGRELGTYILLGLEKPKVARMFRLESLLVGAAALLSGILLGGLVHQALRAAVLPMFGLAYHFSLGYSLRAIGLTVLYFSCIFLVTTGLCGKRIRGMSIRDMMELDEENETGLIATSKKRRKLFTASIICGVLGTLMLVSGSLAIALAGALLLIFFCYGFFISFASGVPGWFEKRPAKKYSGTTLLVFRSLSSKLASMGITMGTIALIFTTTLVATGMGLLFQNQFRQMDRLTTGFDLFLSTPAEREGMEKYEDYLRDTMPLSAQHRYTTFHAPTNPVGDYLMHNSDSYWPYFERDQVMRYSDYAALREMLGLVPVTVADGEYIVHCMDHLAGDMEGFGQPIEVGGQTLARGAMCSEVLTQYSWNGNGAGFILVVPDVAAAGLDPSREIWAMLTPQPVGEEIYSELLEMAGYDDTIVSREGLRQELAFSSMVFVFPLYYLALVLVMVAATILTVQFLSDAEKLRGQYAILASMGMDRRDMRKTLRRHFGVFYGMPVLPPTFICISFITALGQAYDAGIIAGALHLLGIIGTCLGVFFAVYLLYVLAASSSLKRVVLPK